jgi:NADH-quinone oxidoreductase subunit G
MAYVNIPDTGLLLDATPWAGLPYAEGPTLHFKPAEHKEAPRG